MAIGRVWGCGVWVAVAPSGTSRVMRSRDPTPTSSSSDLAEEHPGVLGTYMYLAGGDAEGPIRLGALNPRSYTIVMIDTRRLGYPLVLMNPISVDADGKFVSVSPESLQPSLR